MSKLEEATDSNFETEVLQASQPVLVDFWATWCRPCQLLTPVLEEASQDYAGKLKIMKLNVEDNSNTPTKYGVRGIPTLIIYKHGKPAATKAGYMTKTQLNEFIDAHL